MKKLEDFFNLPAQEVAVEVEETPAPKTVPTVMEDAKEVFSAISTAEKVDAALPSVSGLDSHDSEMDKIADKAIRTFEDLISLGGNVNDRDAGKIYEVAGQVLKVALEAKNSKAEKKLRMVELQLKKIRAEQIDLEMGGGTRTNSNMEFDRSELMKHIASSKFLKSDK